MKIRSKISIIFTLAWISLLAISYLYVNYTLKPSYRIAEQQVIHNNIERISIALKNRMREIKKLNLDWAHWNDTYNYMTTPNRGYEHSNLVSSTFENTDLNFILFFNKAGKYRNGRYYNLDNDKFLPIPTELLTKLTETPTLIRHNSIHSTLTGLLSTPGGIVMLSSVPILTSNKQGQINGTLLMGRLLDHKEISKLISATNLPINLIPLPEIYRHPGLLNIYHNLTTKVTSYSSAHSSNILKSYFLIKDVTGDSIAILEFTTTRHFWQQSLNAAYFFSALLATTGIILLLLIGLLLKYFIFNRLYTLNSEVAKFSTKKKVTPNISISGNDEISDTASAVNSMLTVIKASQKNLEQQLQDRTIALTMIRNHDPLTDLPNRALFNELLHSAIANAERTKEETVIVMLLDIDRFQIINEMYDHKTGDEFLRLIADKLQETVRKTDIVARIGGDEFAFLLSRVKGVSNIEVPLKRILEVIRTPHKVKDIEFRFSGSIGISVYPNDGKTVEELLSNADTAMHKAKKSGGNTFCYYRVAMNQELKNNLILENELRNAINLEQILLYYQPIVDIENNATVGLEALARWDHPSGNLIMPEGFITAAEKSDLIYPLGNLILKRACLTKKAWEKTTTKPLFLTINFSAKQFLEKDFVTTAKKIIQASKVKPESIVIELTESILTSSVDTAIKKLSSLNKLGIKIAIDDFGTGYSSLSLLKKLPIHFLKIDKSFVDDLGFDQDSNAIVAAIIALGKTLKLGIIAEGVETTAQLRILKKMGCHFIQGFLFYPPLSEGDVTDILTKKRVIT